MVALLSPSLHALVHGFNTGSVASDLERSRMICMAEKTPGRSKKNSTAKKSARPPIPIDSGISPVQPPVAPTENRSSANTVMEEEIRLRAYELYEERGRQDGFQDEDWSRAESEILAKHRRGKTA